MLVTKQTRTFPKPDAVLFSYFVVHCKLAMNLLLLGRPTELDEKDVYLCEERYNEHDKDFKRLKGLKVRAPQNVMYVK